jgi:dipeptidyl aminopeptidase/acylaminoacyl peptidase
MKRIQRWAGRTLLGAALLAPLVMSGASTPAQAAFPGRNGTIVVELNDWGEAGTLTEGIYTIAPDDRTPRLLRAGAHRPTWSPDGTRIAFEGGIGEEQAIWVMQADGSNATRLTPPQLSPQLPAWAPDGGRIVFMSAGDLYTIDTDGRNLQSLTSTPEYEIDPTWSPDGRTIVFYRHGRPFGGLYAINVDGTNERQLTPTRALPEPQDWVSNSRPDWAPDGRSIVYHQHEYSNGAHSSRLMLMQADGSNPRPLVSGGDMPVWAPDGAKILYNCGDDLCVVNPDGSQVSLIQRAPAAGTLFFPDWQPLPQGMPTPTTPPVTGTPAPTAPPSATPAPTGTPSPSAPTVTSLTLIDAATDKAVPGYEMLADGVTLDLATLPRQLTVRANTSPATVGSVRFTLDGRSVKTENTAPYAIAGDRNGTDYLAWRVPGAGAHTLSATAFSAKNGNGTPGAALSIRLTIVNAPAAED